MRGWTLIALLSVAFLAADGRSAVAQQGGQEDDSAQNRPSPELLHKLRRALIRRFDENSNGRLDPRERQYAIRTVKSVLAESRGRFLDLESVPESLRLILALFDYNEDGKLGPREKHRLLHMLPHAAVPPRVRPPQRPGGDRPNGDRPNGNRPGGDRPDGDRPNGDRPNRPNRPDVDGDDDPNKPRLTPEMVRRLRKLLLEIFDKNHNKRLDPHERHHAHRAIHGFLRRHKGEPIEIASAPPRLRPILGLFDLNKDGKLGRLEKGLLHRALHIIFRHKPKPPESDDERPHRPDRPHHDRPLGDDLDNGRPQRPADDGFEVRPGRPPLPDF